MCLIANFGEPTIRQVWLKQRLDGDPPPPAAPDGFHGGALSDDHDLPEGHSLNPRAGIPGPWSERLPHFRLDAPPSKGGDELQSEYYVDRRHGRAAVAAMLAMGDLAARFPRLPDFIDLVSLYDPTAKFNNPFLDRLRPANAEL